MIEYFYSVHSAFAWIGANRLQEIADQAGRRIVHRPFDFIPVITAANGGTYLDISAERMKYFFGREIDRWAEMRDQPCIHTRPVFHDEPQNLAAGMVLAAQTAGQDVNGLSREILGMHWRDDGNINGRDDLTRAAKAADLDPDPLILAALTPDVQAQFRAYTEEAIQRSVFGSPTYVVDGDMFYGQDHLEMVERALQRPFRPSPA
ncbi:2-hydroxychromene-2-carboxylate isomerase [Halocynthiibacter namhaensis]|uniref:2-hydroxychromene-2-carboxylate isomerase n=1 Tax=Halocynthiibacter namhaensis TaxID=1290553 RepID=UPI00057927B4|nr:DsbA family protein [Halocynthiibacter namhaensis]